MSNTRKEEEEEEFKVWLCCPDGVSIDAEPYATESIAIRECYKDKVLNKVNFFESNSDILDKVREFCVERAKIQNDHADDQNLVQEKLNDFNSKFLKQNHTHAIDLMIVAFKLDMKNLLDLLMDDVVDILTSMTSEEIYKIFFVNLKDYDHIKFEVMVDVLHECDGAFNQIN